MHAAERTNWYGIHVRLTERLLRLFPFKRVPFFLFPHITHGSPKLEVLHICVCVWQP